MRAVFSRDNLKYVEVEMKKTWLEVVKYICVSILKRQQLFYSRAVKVLLIATVPFVFSSTASAKIPEPDNIVYGTLTYNNVIATPADNQLTVRFELFGSEIASYQMGGASIGNNYMLKIPVDVLDPRAPLTARPGETGQIYISKPGVNILAGTFVVGERGSTLALNISGFNDTDGDGLPDEWEVLYGLNPSDNTDAILNGDTDALTNLQEFQNGTSPLLGDTDGDGFSDSAEVLAGTDPTNSQSLSVVIVSTPVTDGVESQLYSYALQANQSNVVYTLVSAPAGASIVDNAGVNSIQWTPISTDIGVHAFSVTGAVSGVPSDTQSYSLSIVAGGIIGDVNGDGVGFRPIRNLIHCHSVRCFADPTIITEPAIELC